MTAPSSVLLGLLPPSALAYFLLRGAAPGQLAPLHRLGPPAPPDASTLEQLARSGLLNPGHPTQPSAAFGDALDVLRDPAIVLSLRFWGHRERRETHLYAPAALAGGGTVALNRDDDGLLRIASPLSGADVTALVRENSLVALARTRAMPLEIHADLALAAAWLGAIDHARARVWDGLARPEDPADAGLIIAFVSRWWGIGGLDAGLTSLAVLAEAPSPPAEGDLRDALRLLVERGLLGAKPRGLVPLGVTRQLVYDGHLPPIGMQWQQTVRDGAGLIVGHRIVLSRIGGLALCLDRTVPGHVLLRTILPGTLVDELSDRLLYPVSSLIPVRSEAAGPASPEPLPPPAASFCTACGAAQTKETDFCTSCGHRNA